MKVYLIGTDDFKSELKNVGLTVYGGEEDNEKIMNSEIFRRTVTDPEVEAVVSLILQVIFKKFEQRLLEKMRDLTIISLIWLLCIC